MCVARETSVRFFLFCCLSFSVIIVLSATALLQEEVLSCFFFFGERWFEARMERYLHTLTSFIFLFLV